MTHQTIDIGIPEAQLTDIVEGLSKVLADTYTLYLKTHNYHWNVVGPMFLSLHAMFEVEYNELALAVDERLVRADQLGAAADLDAADQSGSGEGVEHVIARLGRDGADPCAHRGGHLVGGEVAPFGQHLEHRHPRGRHPEVPVPQEVG